MGKPELEYAESLIYKYREWTEFDSDAIQCSIIDVENTIEALSRQYTEIWGKGKDWKFTEEHDYYQNVLQILKDKL